MSEMVERIARAINPKAWDDAHWVPIGAREEQLSAQETARRRARAVLQAMREVTLVFREDGQVVHEMRGAPDTVWKAMLTAALEDPRHG